MTDLRPSFLLALVHGIATTLQAEATRRAYYWDPVAANPYPPDTDVSIVRTISPGSDDATRSLAVTPYDQDGDSADHAVLVQFKIRARTDDEADEIEADVFDVFADRPDGTLGSVELVQSLRTSGTSLGQVGAVPYVERTENYRFDVHRPHPHSAN